MPAIESSDDALLHHARTLAMLACESYVSVGGKQCQTCAQTYEAHILKGVIKMLDAVNVQLEQAYDDAQYNERGID